MKYVIIHGDGMADWACEELGGKTPLEAAHKPNMDLIATRGTLGLVATIPEGMPPGSDVGTMTMLGYDPTRYHTGRAPIEAASMGIAMGPRDVVFRMNLVSLKPDESWRDGDERLHLGPYHQRGGGADRRGSAQGAGGRRHRVFQRRQLSASDGVARRNRDDPSHAAARHHRQAHRGASAQGRGRGSAARPDETIGGDSARASGESGAARCGQARGDVSVVLGAGHAPGGADAEGTLRRRRLGDLGRRSRQRPRTARGTRT